MKVTDSLFRRQRGQRGFILVLVLGMLVLITVIVIAFLSYSTSQSKSIASYRDQTGNLLLGDVAVNIVKAQIDDAVSASAAGSGSTAGLWASQPGAIRTINSSGVQTTYKLYSSSQLQDTNTASTLKTDILADIPTAADSNDWAGSPVWTDLNAPAIESDGKTYVYPIIDVVNDPTDLPTGSATTAPFTNGNFNIDTSPVNNPIGATRTASGNYPLPMPVRWLYVLKQGQIIAPDSTSTAPQVTFNKAPTVPSSANPIVGRIAYWTDDDTCRVNVNTASYGTFWDTPRFTSLDDELLAKNQPVHNEYQRYPGHPGMTTLTLALPELATNPEAVIGLSPRYYSGGSTEGTVPSGTTSTALGPPGAAGKTNRLYASVDELLFDPPPGGAGTRTASSILVKKQVESAKFFLTAHSRAPELNLFGEPRVAMWPICSVNDSNHRTPTDQLIAFCSTTPPANATATPNNYYFARAPFDPSGQGNWVGGMAGSNGCVTTGNSSTSDVLLPRNVNLMSYLDSLTSQALPGNLSGASTYNLKYTQLGSRQILTEIFDYIRMTNARDPELDPVITGTAGQSGYAAINANDQPFPAVSEGDGQILPSVYNWPGTSQITYGYGRFSGNVVEASLVFFAVGQGIPSTTPATAYIPAPAAGSGCNYIAVPQAQANTTSPAYMGVTPAPAGTGSTLIPPPGTTAVQGMFVLTFFDPALGYDLANADFSYTVSGLNGTGVTLNGTQIGFPTSTSVQRVAVGPSADCYCYPNAAGSFLPWQLYVGGEELAPNPATGTIRAYLPFFSKITNVSNSSAMMSLGGLGTITVNIYPQSANGASVGPAVTPLRTYVIDLSPLNKSVPVPGIIKPTSVIYPSGGSGPNYYWPRNLVGSIRTAAKSNLITADRFDDYATNSTKDYNGQSVANFLDGTNDTVLSMVPNATYGDYRMLAPYSTAISNSNPILAGTAFVEHPAITGTLFATTKKAYGWEVPGGGVWMNSQQGTLVSVTPGYYNGTSTTLPSSVNPAPKTAIPAVPATVSNPSSGGLVGGAPPDFDNGFAFVPDGPYINKPDEGVTQGVGGAGLRPYYDTQVFQDFGVQQQIFESPERQVPSPVMFGSLPTGAPVGSLPAKPWQTLLFQPGATGHVGLNAPKDEYLLDLFWMPQTQPYAISEPFSTAGKVNLNYQIFPFLYIDRSTALQSVLASEKVARIGSNQAAAYKNETGTNGEDATFMTTPARFALSMSEVDGTLSQFVQRFNNLDFFHTAAEICDVYLVPLGQSWIPNGTSAPYTDNAAQTAFYGPNFALVGDNTREKPYADIYSRITTKSNSFTVYYRVQTLKNPTSADQTQWTEGQGTLLGDYRGSTTLERFIDPNDTTIPDYTTAPAGTANLETHYKWRVVENTRFSP